MENAELEAEKKLLKLQMEKEQLRKNFKNELNVKHSEELPQSLAVVETRTPEQLVEQLK